MNSRAIFRLYAQQIYKKEAKEFVRIEDDFYNLDSLITKNNQGDEERCTIDYKEMVHWLFKEFKIEKK